MTVRTGLLTVSICLLVVLAGCSGGGGSTETPATDIVDTLDSTPTPTSQDRVESGTQSATATPSDSSTATATDARTSSPTEGRTSSPTASPTDSPEPTDSPTTSPSSTPTATATDSPTATPTASPTATPTATPDTPGQTATVVDIIDGDTVKLRFSDGSRDTARLLGVDTPETYNPVNPDEWEGVPDTEAGRACLSDWGNQATKFTTDQLLGETVQVTFDENEPKRGYYDRLLVYVHVDGELFNDDLVKQGYARVYTDSQFTKKDAFLGYEEQAQSANRGAWTCRDAATATPSPSPTPTESSAGSADADALVVDEIHEDAGGNDHENENGEWVRFRNTGDAPLDVSGWTVSDAADHTYRMPAGTVLDPGATLTLYTGSGTDTADSLYWGSNAAIWNNGGDTVIVHTDEGDPVLEHEY